MAIKTNKAIKISQKHLLGIQDLSISDVNFIGETVEGENFVMKGRSSAMLEKNDGKWLFRHVHSSVPDYDSSEGNSFAGN